MTRVLAAILACIAAALASRADAAAAPDVDALRAPAMAAEDARFRRTVELADFREREGNLAAARDLYAEALALRPDDTDVTASALGVLRRLGDSAGRLALAERLAARRPGDAALAFERAECLWRLGRKDEAKLAWQELLRRFPADARVYDDLVDFYASEGLPAEARAVLVDRRRRLGDAPELKLIEARIALVEKDPSAAIDDLLAALDAGLDGADRERAEVLLAAVAAESGRRSEVAKKLAESVERAETKLVARSLDIAQQAAESEDFADAVALAERVVGLIKDRDTQLKTLLQIGTWKLVQTQR